MKLLRTLLLATLAIPLFGDPLASNAKAIALLEKSLAAHGGRQENLRASVTLRSDFINEQQSLAAFEPFETYPLIISAKIDQPAKRVRVLTENSLPGDFHFQDITLLDNGKGFSLTVETKTWRENTQEPPILNRLFPHRYLLQALANRASVRSAGANAITYATPTGALLTLRFDPKTSHLTTLEQLLSMGALGDAAREVTYAGYRTTGTLVHPSSVTITTRNAVHGKVTNRYRYEDVSDSAAFTAEELAVPREYTRADYSYRGNFAAKTLAPGVHLLENVTSSNGQWSYNVMAIEFADHVMILESPVSNAVTEQVLAKVRELAPGKPVRYLVQSHHHGDHLAGVRGYIAEGATLVTTAVTRQLVEKIAAAPSLLDPDRLQRSPRKPSFEVVPVMKTFRDATREVVVHNFIDTPHAKEILIVWLPNERILYQGDLINDNEYPDNDGTRDFLARLQKLQIEPKTIVGLHGRVRNQ